MEWFGGAWHRQLWLNVFETFTGISIHYQGGFRQENVRLANIRLDALLVIVNVIIFKHI